jgi:hypothetical protein
VLTCFAAEHVVGDVAFTTTPRLLLGNTRMRGQTHHRNLDVAPPLHFHHRSNSGGNCACPPCSRHLLKPRLETMPLLFSIPNLKF